MLLYKVCCSEDHLVAKGDCFRRTYYGYPLPDSSIGIFIALYYRTTECGVRKVLLVISSHAQLKGYQLIEDSDPSADAIHWFVRNLQ